MEFDRRSPRGVNPQDLVGLWVEVEGLGYGEVLSFDKEDAWGADSHHNIDFVDHGQISVLLRRRKFITWNAGFEFHIVDTGLALPKRFPVESEVENNDEDVSDVERSSNSPTKHSSRQGISSQRQEERHPLHALEGPSWNADTQEWDSQFTSSVNRLRNERLKEFYDYDRNKLKLAWRTDLRNRLTHRIDLIQMLETSSSLSSSGLLERAGRFATRRHYWDPIPRRSRFYWEKTTRNRKSSLSEWWVALGRSKLRQIVEDHRFDWTCLSIVFANALVMAIEDPENPQPRTVDLIFNIIFTIEMCIRLLALGWMGIWKDLWTRVDSFIVVLSWVVTLIDFLPAKNFVGSEINSIRAIRILKVLKTFKFLDSLKDMIRCIFISLIRLRDVLLFVLFFIYGASQVGMQLFSGSPLRYRCVYKSSNELVFDEDEDEGFCSQYGKHRCPEGQRCVDNIDGNAFKNPWYGFIGFDNLLQAMLTVLVIASLEGHDEIMYKLIKVTRGEYAIPYTFMIVLLVSYFSLNLILAVIYDSYTAVVVQEKQKKKDLDEAAALLLHADFSDDDDDGEKENIVVEEKKPRVLTMAGTLPSFDSEIAIEQNLLDVDNTVDALAERENEEDKKRELEMANEEHILSWRKKIAPVAISEKTNSTSAHEVILESRVAIADSKNVNATPMEIEATMQHSIDSKTCGTQVAPKQLLLMCCNGCCLKQYICFRDRCYKVVVSDRWYSFIYLCIMLNFVLLACEFHGMPDWYADIITYCNQLLIFIFVLEIIMNVLGLGIKHYTHDTFNTFDAIIVFCSCAEIFLQDSDGAFNLSTLRSLRLFRVLRGLKVLRHWDSMRQIMKALVETAMALTDFGLLLVLFVFMFALLGKASFGKQFVSENGFSSPYPRRKFDNIGQAMLSVFQVLTGEDWTNILVDCMRVGWFKGSAYIITMFIFGGVILLSLFLAILIDNFHVDHPDPSTVARRRHRLHPTGPVHFLFSNIYKRCKSFMAGQCEKGRSQKFREWVKKNHIEISMSQVNDLEVSDDALKEYYLLFNHVDADKSSSISKEEITHYITEYRQHEYANKAAERSNVRLSKLVEYLNIHSAHEDEDIEMDFRAFAYMMDQADVIFDEKFHRLSAGQEETGLKRSLSVMVNNAAQRLQSTVSRVNPVGLVFQDDNNFSSSEDSLSMDDNHVTKYSGDPLKEMNQVQSNDQAQVNDSMQLVSTVENKASAPALGRKLSLSEASNTLEAHRLEAIYSDPVLRLQRDDLKLTFSSILPHIIEGTYHRGHRVHTSCFRGCEIVDALLTYGRCTDVEIAVHVGQLLLDAQMIVAVSSRDAKQLDLKRNPLVFTDTEELFRAPDIAPHIMSILGQTEATKERHRAKLQRRRNAMKKAYHASNNCCGSGKNPFRRYCMAISTSPYFDRFILLLIGASMVVSSLNHPDVVVSSSHGRSLFWADVALTLCFLFEMVIKIAAFGLIRNPTHAYLRDPWNILDCVIVIISIIGGTIELILYKEHATNAQNGTASISVIKAIRGLRSLRALKAIKGSPGLRRVVRTVISTIPVAGDIALFLLIVVMFFSAIGLNFYSGLFYYCQGDGDHDKYNRDKDECIGEFWNEEEGMFTERKWVNMDENFDNFGFSMLTLIEVGSLEQWPTIFNAAFDATDVDKHPVKGYSPTKAVIFFVCYILLGSFIVFNLLVGAIITKFQESDTYGHLMLAEQQLSWIKVHKFILGSMPADKRYVHVPPSKRPWWAPKWTWAEHEDSWIKIMAYDLVTHKNFDRFMISCVVINCAIISCSFYGEPKAWTVFIFESNRAFCFIYVAEVLIKWYGLGIGQYFQYNSNIFDFVLVLLCIVETAINSITFGPQIRLLRVARLGRLINYSNTITAIFRVLVLSLPALVNVASLLILIFLIYGIIGMTLFGNAPFDGEFITAHNNFDRIGWALLTLSRCATGASWNGVMHSLANSTSWVAYPYFVTFVFITSWVLLNLFVVIVLDHFAHMSPASNTPSLHLLIDHFREAWSRLSPRDPLFIDTYMLGALALEVGSPLGVSTSSRKEIRSVHLDLWEDIHQSTPTALVHKSWVKNKSVSLLSRGVDHEEKSKRREEITRVVEFVMRLRLKETCASESVESQGLHHQVPPGKVFYLDILSSMLVQCKDLEQFDASSLFPFQYDEISASLKQETGRTFRRAFRKLANTRLRDVAFGDIMNAALSVQSKWRRSEKIRRRRRNEVKADVKESKAHCDNHKGFRERLNLYPSFDKISGLQRYTESIQRQVDGRKEIVEQQRPHLTSATIDIATTDNTVAVHTKEDIERLQNEAMQICNDNYRALKVRWDTLEQLHPSEVTLKVLNHAQPRKSEMLHIDFSIASAADQTKQVQVSYEDKEHFNYSDDLRRVHELHNLAKATALHFEQQLQRLVGVVNEALDPQKLGLPKFKFHLPFHHNNIFKASGELIDLKIDPIRMVESVVAGMDLNDGVIEHSGTLPRKADKLLDYLSATIVAEDPYMITVLFHVLLNQEKAPYLRICNYSNAFCDMKLPVCDRTHVMIHVQLLYPSCAKDFEVSGMPGTFNEEYVNKCIMVCSLSVTLGGFVKLINKSKQSK